MTDFGLLTVNRTQTVRTQTSLFFLHYFPVVFSALVSPSIWSLHFCISLSLFLWDRLGMMADPAARSPPANFYGILGLSKSASLGDIGRAYNSLIMKWHPDRNTSNRAEAEAKFRSINEAYMVCRYSLLCVFFCSFIFSPSIFSLPRLAM